jgi:iron complex outermembrane receptor protein
MKNLVYLLQLLGILGTLSGVVLATEVELAEDALLLKQEGINLLNTDELRALPLKDLLEVNVLEVTIATGKKQLLVNAPAIATVITAEDIKAMGATNLDEVLEMVPGLMVGVESNYAPLYTIRGIASRELILLNGVSVNTLYLGRRTMVWGRVPVSTIERIEIIRGPGSAMYGADAFTGVINVITKNKIEGTTIGLRYGSFDTSHTWLTSGGNYLGLDLAVGLEYTNTEGHKQIIASDEQTILDQLQGTQASLTPGSVNLQRRQLDAYLAVSGKHWSWRFNYQGLRNLGLGVGVFYVLDDRGRYAGDNILTDFIYHNPQVTEHWDVTAQLSVYDTGFHADEEIILFPPGTKVDGKVHPNGYRGWPEVWERHTRLNLSSFYSGIDNHQLGLGFGYYYGNIYQVQHIANFGINPATGQEIPTDSGVVNSSDTPYSFLPETYRQEWYLFFQDAWRFHADWELTTGIRYDYYSDFGTTLNPRLALVWQMSPSLSAKLLYGRAFRAPSFYELYHRNNPALIGNPELKPEIINTWELGLDYHGSSKWHLAANFFFYDWNDIVNTQNRDGFTTTINKGEQQGDGLELEAQYAVTPTLTLSGNYALQQIRRQDESLNIAASPKHKVYLNVQWQLLPAWEFHWQTRYLSRNPRMKSDYRAPLDSYTLTDIVLRYGEAKQPWELALSVRNLFDADAYSAASVALVSDLPYAGRNYFLEWRYHF